MKSHWGRSKVVTKANPWLGLHVHPRPGRKLRLDKGPDLPPSGGVDGIEHKFVRCKQCGFVNNTFVNQRGSGWGNEIAITNKDFPYGGMEYDNPTSYDDPSTYDSSNSKLYNDVDTGAGCPLCGSSEYV